MTQVQGTPQTDEVIAAIAEGIKSYKAAAADGKIDWSDLGYIMPIMIKLGPAVQNIQMVLPELKDLDSAEAVALIAKISGMASESSDKVKAVLEGLILVTQGAFKIVGAFKAAV